jgi:hypothetical protein
MKAGLKVLLLFFLSAGCLVSLAQGAPGANSALTGIWNISGTRGVDDQVPFLALSFAVVGDTVYGRGQMTVHRSNCKSGMGAGFGVRGKVAEDGTFQVTGTIPETTSSSLQFSLRGAVPKAGERNWKGDATIEGVPARPTDCVFRFSRDFVATAYPSLSGTYTGTITGRDLGTDLNVSLQLAQERVAAGHESSQSDESSNPPDQTPPSDELSRSSEPYMPLNATISVNGNRYFTSKAVTAAAHWVQGARVNADGFTLVFPTEDGSTIQMFGFYTDISGLTLEVMYQKLTSVDLKPEIGSVGSGKLTRQ